MLESMFRRNLQCPQPWRVPIAASPIGKPPSMSRLWRRIRRPSALHRFAWWVGFAWCIGCTSQPAPPAAVVADLIADAATDAASSEVPHSGDVDAAFDAAPDAQSDAQRDDAQSDAQADSQSPVADVTADLPSDLSPPQESWRSALFPADWTPNFTGASGAFLHDFSYAGYGNGSVPLPSLEELGTPTFNVLDFGVSPDTNVDDTQGIQSAIDAASQAGGGVVWFPAGVYRVEGLLEVTTDRVVLSGQGVGATQLHFTRDTAMSDTGNLTFKGTLATEVELALVTDAESRQDHVFVADATELALGDHVDLGWTITEAFVADHYMTDTWGPHNGKWQTIFRRQVMAIDTETEPHRVVLDVPLRYPALVRDGAALRKTNGYISDVGVMDLSVGNAVGWDAAWSHDRAHAIVFDGVSDGFVTRVTSVRPQSAPDSGLGAEGHLQSGGILILRSKRVTIANVVMENAQNRGGGGNGYLFELRAANEVLIRDSEARVGRHNFIQNWEFGTTGCVLLRCLSENGEALLIPSIPAGIVGYSEFHHSLAMANLIDDSVFHDGWKAENRGSYSSGAGLTSTENVLWRPRGDGLVVSRQFGLGYVIGADMDVATNLAGGGAVGSEPEDYVEGTGQGAYLVPASLYEAQLQLRLNSP